MARIGKLVNVVRIVSFFRELRLMVSSILSSFRSLTWLSVVLGLTFYIFGLSFTTGVVTHVEADLLWGDPRYAGLCESFATMGRSFMSLFTAMTGGRDWAETY